MGQKIELLWVETCPYQVLDMEKVRSGILTFHLEVRSFIYMEIYKGSEMQCLCNARVEVILVKLLK